MSYTYLNRVRVEKGKLYIAVSNDERTNANDS